MNKKKSNCFFEKQKQVFFEKGFSREDQPVLSFFESLKGNKNLKYLELGSGLGRFPLKLKNIYKEIEINCIEINPDLAKKTSDKGLETIISNATSLPFKDRHFDIVHCSHLIEHLGFPEIATALDEMVRVTKINGYIIIRSPLMHPDFYWDIDHVRPYPPETILNYFRNQQQQKTGGNNLKEILCWYRRGNYKIHNIGFSKIKYIINGLLALLWTYFKFPFSRKDGYVLILEKK
jgi:SAM-dependent methyltransferase